MSGAPSGRGQPHALILLLALCFGLFAWGIDWGLPGRASWAPDEVVPSAVLDAQRRAFAGGWHEKYPPLHYYLLALAYRPFQDGEARPIGTPAVPAEPEERTGRLALVGRALSLALALGTVALLHRAGLEMGLAPGAAVLAAALVAFMPPFVFYAKLSNLDAPYLFWWSLSLLALLRVLRRGHRLSDYLLLGASAAAAVGTKDQAYGLYVFVPLLLAQARRRAEPARGWRWALLGREMAAGGLVFLLALAAIHNLPANREGFLAHLHLITGGASQEFREFSPDPAGLFGLLVSIGLHLAFVLGVPQLAVCLLGLLRTVRSRPPDGPPLGLLVPGLSYVVTFLAVVLYCYDRFVIPLAVILAFFGGAWLHAFAARGWGARTAVAALLALGALRGASVDLALTNDSRYTVEAWLRAHARNALVGSIGPLEYLPRFDGLRWRTVGPAIPRLRAIAPDLVVVNADLAGRSEAGSADGELYAGLDHGTLGYREVFRHRFRSRWLLVDPEELVDRGGGGLRSNLGKVNPEIRVYAAEPP